MTENPPAFPRTFSDHGGYEGMTLADYFAGQALIGLLSQHHANDDRETVARWDGDSFDREALADRAFDIAEAMMAERKKRQ